MAQVKPRQKVIKALAKGQITIPREFRNVLGIREETLLSVSLVEDHLEIIPLQQDQETLRLYSDEDVIRFLKEDRLDEETARRVRDLLGRRVL